MMVLFHFLFELIKIALLSAIYTFIVYVVFLLLRKLRLTGAKEFKSYNIFWIIYILLFIFMFTYYGDHGLGDESRIPIGYSKTIYADDKYTYTNFLSKGKYEQAPIETYEVISDKLYAKSDSVYIIYDLKKSNLVKFNTKGSYDAYARQHKAPLSDQFTDFFSQYSQYWNGWRFWLLP